eukprot:2342008-Rhodomonas_salina.1
MACVHLRYYGVGCCVPTRTSIPIPVLTCAYGGTTGGRSSAPYISRREAVPTMTIALRTRCALSSTTDIGYLPTRWNLASLNLGQGIPTQGMPLRARYAMSGSSGQALSETGSAHTTSYAGAMRCPVLLHSNYAMCGTEKGYTTIRRIDSVLAS